MKQRTRSLRAPARRKVVVLGGGVAGLTAAHELSERGFEVIVVEMSRVWGGKARSKRVSGVLGTRNLPSEHGFRFIPEFYKHLPDTMLRIPVGKNRTVADNLVSCTRALLARRSPLPGMEFPTRIRTLKDIFQLRRAIRGLGLPLPEIPYFMNKMRILVTSCDRRFDEEFENLAWWDFIGAEKPVLGIPERSEVYKKYLAEIPVRFMVAMNPRKASTRTIGRVAMRMWLDLLYPVNADTKATDVNVDRVLNGPTSEVWIDPWVDHLRSMGVQFLPDTCAEKLTCRAGRAHLLHISRWKGALSAVHHLLQELRALREGHSMDALESSTVMATDPLDARPQHARRRAESLIAGMKDEIRNLRAYRNDDASAIADGYAEVSGGLIELALVDDAVRRDGKTRVRSAKSLGGRSAASVLSLAARKLDVLASKLAKLAQEKDVIAADHYLLALPVEGVARLLDRSPDLEALDPMLSRIRHLERSTDWMVGIQFFLRRDEPIVRGHVILADAPWALTAISQRQFWSRGMDDLGSEVKGVISVDISNWDAPGDFNAKTAKACTPEELKAEVWRELKEHVNEPDRGEDLLTDGDLVDWTMGDGVVHQGGAWTNSSKLLVNTAGSLKDRPDSLTRVSNLFVTGDYVRTNTDLATMEGANEAARRAVNGILRHENFADDAMCELWEPLTVELPRPLAALRDRACVLDDLRFRYDSAEPKTKTKTKTNGSGRSLINWKKAKGEPHDSTEPH